MASEWIKALEDQAWEEESSTVTVVPDEGVEKLEHRDALPDKKKTKYRMESISTSTKVLFGGLAAAAVVVVGGGGIYSALSDPSENTASTTSSISTQSIVAAEEPASAPTVVAPASSSSASLGNNCSAGGVDPSGENSIRGAVAAFETAYFARDAGVLTDAIVKSSSLHEQDWEKILPDAAPDGTKWCAQLGAVEPGATSVDMDLEMTVPGQEPAVYAQTVTGEKGPDGWLVSAVDERKE